MSKFLSILAVAALMAPVGASAEVSFNPANGTGFIGRGDVITYVGKGGVVVNPSVSYRDVATYEVECGVATAGGGKVRKFTFKAPRTQTVIYSILTDTREAKGSLNVTGYLLVGYSGAPTIDPLVCYGPDAPALLPGESWAYNVLGLISAEPGQLMFNGANMPY